MVSISLVMLTLDSDNPWSEKLSLRQNIWIVSSGMIPTTYLASSHAHGRPWVVLMIHPQREGFLPELCTHSYMV